jgi:adenosylhomocysteine nucleosidase
MASARRVLVLCPMPTELSPVVKRLKLAKGPDGAARGTIGGNGVPATDVVACLGGIGTGPAAEIATRMIQQEGPDHVVVCGIAGGLGPTVQIGDLLVAEVVKDLDTGLSYAPTPLGPERPSGRLVTSGELITHRPTLFGFAEDGIDAIDMETGAVAAVADRAGIPWVAYRGISDHLRDDLVDDHTMALMNADGTPNPRNLARYIGRDPRRIARLAKLGRGLKQATAAATEALAIALGSSR